MGNHQTTGSITLDVDAIAAAVVRELRPLLPGAVETLGVGDMADVLRDHLLLESLTTRANVASHLAADLLAAGYRLVRVGEKTSEQRAEDWFAPGRRD